MTILEEIITQKQIEVTKAKAELPVKELKKWPYFSRKTISLKEALNKPDSSGIISEYKRKSPSKGIINSNAEIKFTTQRYVRAGAAGLSILTDFLFFGGSKQDLIDAREANPHIPILRKDFIIDPYQLFEAKAWGADVILLIAANLESEKIKDLSRLAHELDLEVLLEIHDEEELMRSHLEDVDMLGVNNRNLKNFSENNVNASKLLAEKIPTYLLKISESCINDPAIICELKEYGYRGFLIGENFMKNEDPGQALMEFIEKI